MRGRIVQINVKPRTPGEVGMPKRPVLEARVTAAGVDGDYNHYRFTKKNNYPESALLLMPLEMMRELEREGWPVKPGDIGENFTTEGVPYENFRVGTRWRAGDVEFEISKPCTPCDNLGELPYVGEERANEFIKVMMNRRGWHAFVTREGVVRVGDTIESLDRA